MGGGGVGGAKSCVPKIARQKKIPTINSVFFPHDGLFGRGGGGLARGHGVGLFASGERWGAGGGGRGGSSRGCQLFERTLALPDGDLSRGDIQSWATQTNRDDKQRTMRDVHWGHCSGDEESGLRGGGRQGDCVVVRPRATPFWGVQRSGRLPFGHSVGIGQRACQERVGSSALAAPRNDSTARSVFYLGSPVPQPRRGNRKNP